jgi:hypothetical protein
MRTRPLRSLTLPALGAFAWLAFGPPPRAQAQEPAAPPPPPSDPYAAAPAAAPSGAGASTDHDTIVRRWGVDVRQLATLNRSPGQDPACDKTCPIDAFALGLRRWSTSRYAWSVGLALVLGGGGTRLPDGKQQAWDTYFGAGPTVGARFLLANWQHLAVSWGPQIDFVFFMPSGSGGKTTVITGRGEVEGEVHLGMIGLPAASVGLTSGLAVSYRHTSPGKMPLAGTTARAWSVGFLGPTALWDLVTKAYLRYYF